MYVDDTYSGIRLTAESVSLWEQHSHEYVTVKAAEMVEIAESLMRQHNADDAETAMSLLAEDGVTVQLLNHNTIDDNMPQIVLTPEEVAVAFEAERLFEVSFRVRRLRKGVRPIRHVQLSAGHEVEANLRLSTGAVVRRAQNRGRPHQ